MTIRAMQRAALVLMVAFLAAASFVACGSSDDSTADEGADAQALAEEATELIHDLEVRTDDLAAELDRMDAERRRLADKFDRVHKDLRDAISNVRSSLSDATADAASARDTAQSALNELDAARKRLSVLENRFDYHLRNDH